jgi:hypothetical protein
VFYHAALAHFANPLIGSKQKVSTSDKPAAEEPKSEEDDEDLGVFDLELVAQHFPTMPIREVLECEQRFLQADADGSGVS